MRDLFVFSEVWHVFLAGPTQLVVPLQSSIEKAVMTSRVRGSLTESNFAFLYDRQPFVDSLKLTQQMILSETTRNEGPQMIGPTSRKFS